jgi:hypothetical protein
MLLAPPLNQARSEICRLTVWERADLANFSPGTLHFFCSVTWLTNNSALKYSAGVVYEIRHVFNLNLYNKMPQGSATRACAEGRIEVQQPNAGNAGTPPCTADTTAATAATTAGDAADLVSTTPKRKHADESPPPRALHDSTSLNGGVSTSSYRKKFLRRASRRVPRPLCFARQGEA